MTQDILQKIDKVKNLNKKIANMGLKISFDNKKPIFFKSIEELENEIKKINTKNVYKIKIEIETERLLQIGVYVQLFKSKEINKPFRVIEIARNINAFDLNFEKATLDVYKFWSDLYKRLEIKIRSLSEKEKKQLQKLVENNLFKITTC
jgi:hypothetical protein